MKCPSQTQAIDLSRFNEAGLTRLLRDVAFQLVLAAVRRQRDQGAGLVGDTECPLCGNRVTWATGKDGVVAWAECEALGCLKWPKDSE